MLVLTRKSEESVIISGSIEVKILDIRGDQVRLGFEAPTNVAIHRKEVYEMIEAANRQAVLRGQDQETTRHVLSEALRGVRSLRTGKEGASP